MPLVELSTLILAPRERVFDLARCIDAHQDSTEGTHERAVAGVTTGLIGLNDQVSWEARHLGVRQRLTVQVTALNRPSHFQDIMIHGAFKSMKHDHEFVEHPSGTLMMDRFEFESPFGILGKIVDWLFLRAYMLILRDVWQAIESLQPTTGAGLRGRDRDLRHGTAGRVSKPQ